MISMNGAYINGLDNSQTLEKTAERAAGTATTDYILFSLTVPDHTTGDINYGLGDRTLAHSGVITNNVLEILAPVVEAGVKKGSCTRVWLSIGGAGTQTFSNISQTLANGGEAAGYLTAGLIEIAATLQGLSDSITSVGFDLDNEEPPVALVVPLVNELSKLDSQRKYPFTFCAYSNREDWFGALAAVYDDLGFQPVVGITLQTYAGGEGNDPSTWSESLATFIATTPTGIPTADGFILPILSMDPSAGPDYTPSKMTSQLKSWKSTGASFWATQALSPPPSWADYGSAIEEGIS